MFELGSVAAGWGLLENWRFGHHSGADCFGKNPLPGQPGFFVGAIPDIAQGIAQPLAAIIAFDLDTVQVLLGFQEAERVGNAVNDQIGFRIFGQRPRTLRRFQPHCSDFARTEAGFAQQKKPVASQRLITAGFKIRRMRCQTQRDKNEKRNRPIKLGLSSLGCHRVSFQFSSWLTLTARRPLSVLLADPRW